MSQLFQKINVSIFGVALIVVCAMGVAHFVDLVFTARSDSYHLTLTLGVISGACWLLGSICATGTFYSTSSSMQLLGYLGSVLNAVGAITTLGVAVLGTLPAAP